MLRSSSQRSEAAAEARRCLTLSLSLCAVIAGCVNEPPPRSFNEFMEDRLAREGTLVRCNADRTATANDPECINARRAAAALAAKEDAAQRERRDAQSEARLLAERQRRAAQQDAERRAEIAAQTEEQLAYEAQWEDQPAADPAPIDGEAGEVAAAQLQSGSVTPTPELEPTEPTLDEIVVPEHLRKID